MGCDIHAYMEYRKKGDTSWWGFGDRINPGRHYQFFGKLAGVRGGTAIFPIRGIPSDAGYSVNNDWWLFIVDKETDESGYCSRQQAKEWHEKYKLPYKAGKDGFAAWIQHPDWHTPSWVTSDEWETCIKEVGGGPEYKAMLAALRSLESDGYETRIVFWFDN